MSIDKESTEKIIEGIWNDLCDRRGIKHELQGCDPDIQQEIKDAWAEIIEEETK